MRLIKSFVFPFFICCGWVIWSYSDAFSQTYWKDDFKDFSEISLEDLLDVRVTSASKHEQQTIETPSFVTVITDKMIEAFNYHTIAEALKSVSGFWITSDRYSYYLGVRGVSVYGDWNSRILLLLNGHTLNEQWEGTSNLDQLVGIDMSNVKRIEVVKGPGSSLYGSNAFFGVINVITKDAETIGSPRLETGFTSKANQSDGVFSWGRKYSNDFQVFLSGTASNATGSRLFFPEYRDLETTERLALEENGYSKYFLSLDQLTGGYTSKTDFLHFYSLILDILYKDWSVLSKLSDRDKGIPSGYYGSVFNTGKNRMEERFSFLELKYLKPFLNKHKFIGRLYYDDYYFADWILYNYYSDPEQGYENPPFLPGPVWMDEGIDKFWGTEMQLDFHFFSYQRLVLGGEYQDHEVEQRSGETDNSEKRIENDVIPFLDRKSDMIIFNLYLQNEYRPIKELNLVVGLHHNNSTHCRGRVTSKLGVLFFPQEKTAIKFLFSQGFRAPSIYERTFDDATYFIGNDRLVPEEINSYELVVEKYVSWARIVTTYYVNEAQKIITQAEVDSTDPAYPGGTYEDVIFQYRNAERIETKGVEVSVERNLKERWCGFFNFSYNQTKDKQTGLRLFNSPEFLANLGLNYQWMKNRFGTSVELQYVDKRKAYDDQIAGSYVNTNLSFVLKKVVKVLDVYLLEICSMLKYTTLFLRIITRWCL